MKSALIGAGIGFGLSFIMGGNKLIWLAVGGFAGYGISKGYDKKIETMLKA